jgi:hypothetical protein
MIACYLLKETQHQKSDKKRLDAVVKNTSRTPNEGGVRSLQKKIMLDEIKEALKESADDKSPGLDGH